jgi:ribosomal protein S18 acetylase RimI-like enzyme
MYMVRKAIAEDAQAILEIQKQGWIDTYTSILGIDKVKAINEKGTIQHWHEIIARERTVTLVVENAQHQIAGYVCCGRNRDKKPEYPGEIYTIYVSSAHHKGGYGKGLFQAATEYLQAHQLTPFVVWVFKDNPACRFYEKMGGHYITAGPSHTDPAIIQHCYGFKAP